MEANILFCGPTQQIVLNCHNSQNVTITFYILQGVGYFIIHVIIIYRIVWYGTVTTNNSVISIIGIVMMLANDSTVLFAPVYLTEHPTCLFLVDA